MIRVNNKVYAFKKDRRHDNKGSTTLIKKFTDNYFDFYFDVIFYFKSPLVTSRKGKGRKKLCQYNPSQHGKGKICKHCHEMNLENDIYCHYCKIKFEENEKEI